jgi:Isochorismatase family
MLAQWNRCATLLSGAGIALFIGAAAASETPTVRAYENRLAPLANTAPLLGDHPDFVEPVRERNRFEAPVLVDDRDADLEVRAWRFSYNARGIIEIPNRLRARQTAIIVVHPWAIDDGQGWTTPAPAGVAFACTPEKNRLCLRHMKEVVNPFLKSLRGAVGLVAYSLPGSEDATRKKLYRSIRGQPSAADRAQGARDLAVALRSFSYNGKPLPNQLSISADKPVVDYFRQFPGLDAGDRYDPPGFWQLPIPVARPLEVDPRDVVIYDPDGYPALKRFLQEQGIRHILLAGYHADMCVCRTTAGYANLRNDFNVFLVGDAMLATFPANLSCRFATNATVSFAALEQLITQVSWVHLRDGKQVRSGGKR